MISRFKLMLHFSFHLSTAPPLLGTMCTKPNPVPHLKLQIVFYFLRGTRWGEHFTPPLCKSFRKLGRPARCASGLTGSGGDRHRTSAHSWRGSKHWPNLLNWHADQMTDGDKRKEKTADVIYTWPPGRQIHFGPSGGSWGRGGGLRREHEVVLDGDEWGFLGGETF